MRAVERVALAASVRALLAPEDPALERVLWRMRLRLRRRVAWLRARAQADGPIDEIDLVLAGRDDPHAEADWYASDKAMAAVNAELLTVEREIAKDRESRLARLVDVFRLDAREIDVLHACLAAALEPALAVAVAYAAEQGGDAALTESLVGRLFGYGRRGAPAPGGALLAWELVRRQETASGVTLRIDPLVHAWLLGRDVLDATLAGRARVAPVLEPLPNWPVDATAGRLREALDADAGARSLVQVAGVPASGRRSFAAAVADVLGFPALAIDVDEIDPAEWGTTFRRVQRQAFLTGAAPVWHGEQARRRWPPSPDLFAVQFVCCEPGAELAPHAGVVDHFVELPQPSTDERRALWAAYVPGSAAWAEGELDALVGAHRVGPGDIAAAARRRPRSALEAGHAVSQAARHRLGELAQRLECSFTWDDLVADDELKRVLEDFVFEAQTRGAFWERSEAQRLFPQGRGLVALFNGPPGTGKTMAAQVVARRLRLDLFRIDLSTIVSKYVGETSQNLERVMRRASRTDAVLFFDEADALFGKRTEIRDAHDRFANTDTGYLLQAIESYQGVAVLATNRKANIDPAFLRRLRYVIDFARPDAAHRLAIWRQIVAELAGEARLAALEPELRAVAESVEATGAQIKSSVLGGLFAARRARAELDIAHLMRALDRELLKEGRVMSDRERRRVLDHAR